MFLFESRHIFIVHVIGMPTDVADKIGATHTAVIWLHSCSEK